MKRLELIKRLLILPFAFLIGSAGAMLLMLDEAIIYCQARRQARKKRRFKKHESEGGMFP